MENGLRMLTCAICHGPYSPATGHVHTPTMVLCGRCARDFYMWYRKRMVQMSHSRNGQPEVSFAEAAATSIIGDLSNDK